MSDYIFVGDELYHYGVPGMRWGHRKARPVSTERARMQSARAAYKKSNREFNKAREKAVSYSRTHPSFQNSKGHKRAEANRRWDDADKKAQQAKNDKVAYKQAKKEYKQTDEYKAKAVKAGAVVAGTALAAYGAYKVNKVIRDKNVHVRIGQELVKANKDIDFTRKQLDSLKRGQSNKTIDMINKSFNKYAAERWSEARNDGINRATSDSLVTAAKNVYENGRKRRQIKVSKILYRR